MTTLDDKLLGEKTQYYYSDSEDEREEDDDDKSSGDEQNKDCAASPEAEFIPEADLSASGYGASRTGPKGVLADWRRFKQLETEKRGDQDREKRLLAEKLSMTCRSYLDDEKAKEDEELDQLQLESMLEDEFMRRYREERMNQMILNIQKNSPRFGKLLRLNKNNFVDAIDSERKEVTVIIHIEDQSLQACESMNGCLHCLAQEYPFVKFCAANAADIQTSQLFTEKGLPALLVYKAGQLIGNFIRVSDVFGEDFFATEVESFLQEHGLLPNKDDAKVIPGHVEEDEDSDLELD
ncbi:phosducin-like protein [Strongylocentrotus purpuratus]|uniref:Phosducin domain-containing protein n=1 Tax=Strongylocentrotus purpuratus TaxID=7668 RepID=A0A7M7SSJ8_STRPU|nr:phosducin-like protein [Strongylocentrotus purpuratus]XP_030828033.1 phosducin-like protein [Strongylocentrotus purpuratus]XP_030828034.1 phosducin-like protein [Strongylocentrotus purpuratus]XP_799253.2 phosducin-like protein [Strongylocentrotus purpuratus]|eukprot:XP_011677737.1 PREDICTED: phosducin-like protein [Strongylocentrotus purpuratus]